MERPATNEYNTRIRELPTSERPRERLRDHGSNSLSNAELLAIILRTGSADQNVVSLANALLAKHGGIGGLSRLSFEDLTRERGLGEAKASELRALFELALRLNALQPESRPFVKAPAEVMHLLGGEMSILEQEHLRVLLLTTRNQLLAVREVYRGTISSAPVRVAEVMREAIRNNAPALIMVHNHPSGDPSPSPDDVVMTKQSIEAGKLLGIDVLDHIIIGDRRFVSLKQLGQI